MNRQRYLRAGAATGALLAVGLAVIPQRSLQAQAAFVRPDIGTLSPTGPEIAALRKGVQVMKSRPATDPTSWEFQANLHGSFSNSNPAWNACQHGHFFFLAWHRLYVYYFERILREASGDKTLALPYWNYTDPGERALPQPFRDPADATNTLWVSQRADRINDGTGVLSEPATSYAAAFTFVNFQASPQSSLGFGGQWTRAANAFLRPHGQLESQPHDIIHVLVGGGSGLMTDPRTAAQDPIFWLHHANIDRLWKRWLDQGGGRANPVNSQSWKTTKFKFFDETGTAVEKTAMDALDTEGQLGYRYADDPPQPTPSPSPSATATPAPPLAAAADDAAMENGPPRSVFVSSRGGAITLGVKPVTVAVPLDDRARAAIAAATAPGAELVLDIEGIDFDRVPGDYYQVFLGLPKGAPVPDHRSPFYAGNLAFFGLKPHVHAGQAGPAPKARHSLLVTDVVRRLQSAGTLTGSTLNVTFVLQGLVTREGAPLPLPPGVRARIQRISLASETLSTR